MKEFFKKLPERKFFGWLLNSKGAGGLAGKCVLMLVIPYAWLFILSAVFGGILTVPAMAPFILYSSLVLLAVNLALIIWAIVRYAGKKK